MDKKSILKKYLPTGLLLAAAAAVGITGATVLHNMTLDNPIKTPPVEIFIDENMPGQNAKEAAFMNTGEADVFLRIAFSEDWVYTKENEEEILENYAKPVGRGSAIKVASPVINPEDWTYDDATGWYYYNKVLPGTRNESNEDKRKTPLFITRVDFNYHDNEGKAAVKDAEKYAAADYQLHFTAEVVQASDEVNISKAAVKELFKKNVDDVLPSDDEAWKTDKYNKLIDWKSASNS